MEVLNSFGFVKHLRLNKQRFVTITKPQTRSEPTATVDFIARSLIAKTTSQIAKNYNTNSYKAIRSEAFHRRDADVLKYE